jgi:hypothetical protein
MAADTPHPPVGSTVTSLGVGVAAGHGDVKCCRLTSLAAPNYLPYLGHTKAREAGSARFSVSSRTRGERAGANSGGEGQGVSRVGGDPALAGRRVDERF